MQGDAGDARIGRWGERFLAYVIDLLIVGFAVGALVGGYGPEAAVDEGYFAWTDWLVASAAFFAYFVVLERLTGYTAGKRLFRLRVSSISGGSPTLTSLLISNFGKAYVMPIDAVIGMIAFKDTKQRAFAKIAGTITVKVYDERQVHKMD